MADITESVQARDELAESQRILNEAGKIAKIGGWEVDALTLKGKWTDEVARIHDLALSVETSPALGLSFYASPYRERIEKAFQEAIELGKAYDLELEFVSAKGIRKWVRAIAQPVLENGQCIKVQGTFQDITDRKMIEFALQESKERIELALQGAELGTWDWNVKTDGVDFNRRWAEMLEYDYNEIQPNKKTWEDLVHPEDLPVVKQILEDHLEGRTQFYEAEIRMRTKTGKWKWILTKGKVIRRDSQGQPLRVAGTHLDITGRKKAEFERARLMHFLETKNEELESIIYISSHDLRSPLVNIMGYGNELSLLMNDIETMIQQKSDHRILLEMLEPIIHHEIPESIRYITSSTQKMELLLDGLLRLCRLGRDEVHSQTVNMNQLIADILAAMHYQLEKRASRVEMGDLPPCQSDPEKLSRVFSNLIDNALKYSHPDRSLCLVIDGWTEGTRVHYKVQDNGIGIDPQYHKRIFEIFHQLDASNKCTGEGLGLTIVKRLMDLLRGQIRVESESGVGSTFFMSLPKKQEI